MWVGAGIDAAQQQQLRAASLVITPLGRDILGQTNGDVIRLSPTADGYGWYVDASPVSGNPFPLATGDGWVAGPGSAAAGHMDLATVLAHEMGHVLGLRDTSQPGDLMAQYLSPGMRRLPRTQDVRATLTLPG
jgi:hypothetical protein